AILAAGARPRRRRGPIERDDVEVAVAVEVAEGGLGAVGGAARQETRIRLVDEDSRVERLVDEQPVRAPGEPGGALGHVDVEIAVAVDVDEIAAGGRRSRVRVTGGRVALPPEVE